jgi:hypothetical protein
LRRGEHDSIDARDVREKAEAARLSGRARCQAAVVRRDLEIVPTPLLQLALAPLLPARTPPYGCTTLSYGYRLRLADGPALEADDPLLSVFAARSTCVLVRDHEVLQLDAFDPGRRLTLLLEQGAIEPVDEVGVWDAERIRRLGSLNGEVDALMSAGLAHGLPLEALSLHEMRDVHDDRRSSLQILIYSPAMVAVDVSAPQLLERPVRPTRRRLVLLADETGGLRWWDPAGDNGPVEACELPMSQELAGAFERLDREFVAFAAEAAHDDASAFERVWARQGLLAEAHRLWLRARVELGLRYVVGFLGPEMDEPIWSPQEVEAEDDEEVAY